MQFKKKPVVIDAIQWDGTNVSEIREHFGAFSEWHFDGTSYVIIKTLEGKHRADPGDWIIKGVKGEFYPCKPDIFDITYERPVRLAGVNVSAHLSDMEFQEIVETAKMRGVTTEQLVAERVRRP